MASIAGRRATYADLLATPDTMVAELINGRLELSPRPGKPHAAAASAIGEELGPPFKRGRGGPGGWIILFEPEVHFAEDVLVPDLAGWRRERMPVMTTDEAYFTLAPDWVCEVISPRSERTDRAEKLAIYAAAKVDFAWLVNPLSQTLEVLHREGKKWLLVDVHKSDAKVRAVPFDAIELDLSILWADVQL